MCILVIRPEPNVASVARTMACRSRVWSSKEVNSKSTHCCIVVTKMVLVRSWLFVNSTTGTRARVARVRAEYPNQLDYSGGVVAVNTCSASLTTWFQQVPASHQHKTYIYIYSHIHIYIYIYVHVCMYMRAYLQICAHARAN